MAATGNIQLAAPGMGSQAGLSPIRVGVCAGVWLWRSSTHCAATAPPAEWPATACGCSFSSRSKSSSAPAISRRPGRKSSAMWLSAWPGRSGQTTVKSALSSGVRSRQVWVDAPAPCSSSNTGPLPEICTCQRTPGVCTKRLQSMWGQSGPRSSACTGGYSQSNMAYASRRVCMAAAMRCACT